MNKLYIVIEHTNGELEDLWVIRGDDFAKYCSKGGYLVYEIDLSKLEAKELIYDIRSR